MPEKNLGFKESPQVSPPVTNIVSMEEQIVDPTLEIVGYLTNLLVLRRQPITQAVLNRDHQMYRRIGQYEEALGGFLKEEPEVLALGDDMHKREMYMEVLSTSYQTEIDNLDEKSLPFQIRQEELGIYIQQLQDGISGIGRNRLRPGDLELLVGKVQVELGKLKARGRLSFLGKFAEKLIGTREFHPAVQPYQRELTEVDYELMKLGEKRKTLAAEHFKEENEQKRRLETDQDDLFHKVDDWVLPRAPDSFLVHYLYYQKPSLGKYLKSHHLMNSDLGIFDQHGLLQKEKHPQKQPKVSSSETLSDDVTELPMPIKIKGEVFRDIGSAWKAFLRLKEGVPQRKMRHFFNRSLMALLYEKQGSHHPDGKIFTADDPIIGKVGGNWRLRIGRYRVIGNLDNMENEQRVPEFVSILQHDDPNYQ
ncbi:MAG: hypothetical protein Q8P92_05245 [Candidatus Daviesbacteria bacterium]|nr:hypothetical protein [Candidatus Daviesbacteria bacterium]